MMRTQVVVCSLSLLSLVAAFFVLPVSAQDILPTDLQSPFDAGAALPPTSSNNDDPFGPSPQSALTTPPSRQRLADAHRDSGQHLAAMAKATLLRLKAEYSRTRDDVRRTALKQEMQKVLTKYFELDMEKREQELEVVKRRVSQLEELMKERAKAKDSLIEAQLDTAVREARGLGFFRTEATGLPGAAISRQELPGRTFESNSPFGP